MAERMRSYDTARAVFSFLEFVTWASVAIGVILVFVGIEEAPRNAKLLGATPGILFTLFGILGVATVQAGRASVDSAEYGQQMLKIARDQLEVSRQSLKRQEADGESFAAPRSTGKQAPNASFGRAEPTVSQQSVSRQEIEPTVYRGERIRWFSGAYRALGMSFETYQDAQKAVDDMLDDSAIEDKPAVPASMLLGQDPTPETDKQLAPVEQPSAEDAEPSPRSYSEAEKPVRPSEPTVATATGEDLEDQEANEEIHEPTQGVNAEPEPSPEEEDPASKINEEGGKFLYGRMEFSSREAAEKYVRQLGVNPKIRS